MYITYYCDKLEIMVLCRFHIRNFTKKAENTLAARYWQFPYISAFDIFILFNSHPAAVPTFWGSA